MSLDREQILAWLDQLGDEDDATALAAARALHAEVAASEVDWDDLLVADEGDEEPETSAESPKVEVDLDNAAVKTLVEKILSRSDLFEGTRQELEEFKSELEAGTFDSGDTEYVQALARRLGVK